MGLTAFLFSGSFVTMFTLWSTAAKRNIILGDRKHYPDCISLTLQNKTRQSWKKKQFQAKLTMGKAFVPYCFWKNQSLQYNIPDGNQISITKEDKKAR